MAGEKEFLARQRVERDGIPINDALMKNLDIMATELGIEKV